jgi:dipeptide transport system substrate-binding protein
MKPALLRLTRALALAPLLAPILSPILSPRAARADTLVVCTEASPDSLNAALSSANTSYDVSEQIGDRLVEMQPGGSALVPALAESWTVSEDGLRYTFKLRPNVAWQSSANFHPTRPMNADDVVFTFQRMFDHQGRWFRVGGSTYQVFQALIEPSLKSVTKTADDAVVFELKAPLAPLLSALSVQPFTIASAEYAAAMERAGTPEQLDLAPIGTGPFQLVQYQKDSLIRFRAFPGFWGRTTPDGVAGGVPDRAAKVDQLVFSITPDASVRFAKLRAGECQIARYPNPADLDAIRAVKGLGVVDSTIASISYLAFRTDLKPFDDVRVREALAISVDLDNLVKAVWQGSGTPTAALVPPALWGHDPNLRPRAHDPARAKALLAQAGYPDGFSTDLWAIPVARAYMPNGKRAAEMIQADWAKIGVKANIVSFEWGEYLRRLRLGEAKGPAMTGATWDYPDPSQLLVGLTCEALPTGRNAPHWCDRAFSDAVGQANLVTDQAARAALYRTAQARFFAEIPALQFADSRAFVALSDRVRGFHLHFLGGQPFGGVSLAP